MRPSMLEDMAMKTKSGTCVVWMSCFALMLCSGAAQAQTSRGGDVRPPDKPKPQRGAEDAPERTRPETARPPKPKDTRELVTRLRELHEAMRESLGLTKEQTERIDEMFEEHFEVLRASIEDSAEQSAEQRRARVAKLRELMKAAREEGDKEKARALRGELRELRNDSRRAQFEQTGEFVKEVGSVLSDEQLGTYKQIVRRLHLYIPQDRRMGEFRRIMQAIRNPELNLTEEQQGNIRGIMREVMGSAERRDGKPTDRAAHMEELERRILAELTAEQREKLDEIRKRSRQRDKEHMRGPRVIKGREYPTEVEPEDEATEEESQERED